MNTKPLIAIALVLAAGFANAQTPAAPVAADRVDQREANQDARISQGVASGQLNQKEATRLEKGQMHVNNLENRAAADGKVTKREARHLEKAQDRQSRRIHRQKHDAQKSDVAK